MKKFVISLLLILPLLALAQPFVSNYTYSGSTIINDGFTNFNLFVPNTGIITSVRIRLNLSVPLTSGCTIGLKNPVNPIVVLFNGSWGTGGTMVNTVIQQTGANGSFSTGNNPFTGYWTSDNSMVILNGNVPSGNWTLTIYSSYGAGTLNGYELEINGGVLPVEMTSFSAVGSDNLVNLNWRTESETNNSHFVLYRSLDHEVRGDILTQIAGHGTTAISHDYSFADTRVQNGNTYYYHISDVDVNGVERVHPLVVSALPSARAMGVIPGKYELTQNFPNPFNPTTEFSYSLPEATTVHLSVYNMLGQEVQRLVNNESQQPNVYRLRFDASKLPAGTYFYQLSTPSYSMIKRMVLMK